MFQVIPSAMRSLWNSSFFQTQFKWSNFRWTPILQFEFPDLSIFHHQKKETLPLFFCDTFGTINQTSQALVQFVFRIFTAVRSIFALNHVRRLLQSMSSVRTSVSTIIRALIQFPGYSSFKVYSFTYRICHAFLLPFQVLSLMIQSRHASLATSPRYFHGPTISVDPVNGQKESVFFCYQVTYDSQGAPRAIQGYEVIFFYFTIPQGLFQKVCRMNAQLLELILADVHHVFFRNLQDQSKNIS